MSAKSATAAATEARLAELVWPVIEAGGYELEELVLTPMGRRSQLRVVIDRDAGVCLDDIAGLSRAVADVLDQDEGVLGKSPYVLEVTSPGVDRPLTEARHWRRAVGRLVEVTLREGGSPPASQSGEATPLRGRVLAFDGSSVTLSGDGGDRKVSLTDLGPGKIQLEFNRPSEDAKRESTKRTRKPPKGRRPSTDDVQLPAENALPTVDES